MAEKKQQEKSYLSVVLTFVLIGVLAMLALIQPEGIRDTLMAERHEIYDLVGADAEMKYYQQAAISLGEQEMKALQSGTGPLGKNIQDTIYKRVEVVWLWITLVYYRILNMTMWIGTFIGFIFGAVCDGFYEWKRRQTSFRSQSPVTHRLGVHTTMLVMVVLIAWMAVPIKMIVWIPALLPIMMSVGVWLWIANMQKRV